MKLTKAYLAPLVLVLFTLGACSKQEQPQVQQDQLVLAASVNPVTRSYFPGNNLLDDISGNYYPIFVSATSHLPSGLSQAYLSGATFNRDGAYYKGATPVYWPLSGSMDILAYAGFPTAPTSGNPSVTWTGTDKLRFHFTDTAAADADLLWAVNNNITSHTASIPLSFKHAMAMLEVDVAAAIPVGSSLTISKVEVRTGEDRLCLDGYFTVDNTYVQTEAVWTGLNVVPGHDYFFDRSASPLEFSSTEGQDNLIGRLGDTSLKAVCSTTGSATARLARMFVPVQARKKLVVYYSMNGGAVVNQAINIPGGIWESGKYYTYKITIDVPTIAPAPRPTTMRVQCTEADL